MTARVERVRDVDVVVIGAGAAGLSVALGLDGHSVDLLAKGPLSRTGNSPLAQGGVAGAVGPDDSPALHAADTLAVGGAVGDPGAVALLTREGPRRLVELIELGARFDRGPSGQLDLTREAAHSRQRILHARDATGAEIVRALGAALGRVEGLSVFEESFALELVVEAGRPVGVLVRHADGGGLVLHRARAVVLATGGLGQLYSRTTNPTEATGDGLALAWQAGARLGDLEYVQFHPTALDVGEDPMPLLTEALRGEGARLVDENGAPIFDVPGGELQARDIVARGIWKALAEGRRPLLDAREAVGDAFPERFPTVFELCQAQGLDPRVEPLPVAPAAHYHMGGILVDAQGRTSRPGLWAAGEVACTGVHGANRLASNSLLEALVYGDRVARSVGESLAQSPRRTPSPSGDVLSSVEAAAAGAAGAQVRRLRTLMWDHAGLVRTGDGLRDALDEIETLRRELPEGASEARNLATVAGLVARAALTRSESRGGHFRADHPDTRSVWMRRIVLSRVGEREHLTLEPIPDPAKAVPLEVSA
jgi:L-aspartate oxidase